MENFPLMTLLAGDKMDINIPKPEKFDDLCHAAGFTLLIGQLLHSQLAHYFSIHSKIERKVDDETINTTLAKHLSKP